MNALLRAAGSLFGPGSGRIFRSRTALVIFLSSLLMMLNAHMFSPLLPTLSDVYAVPDSSVGLMMTAYTLPPVVLIPFIGVLSDRVPRRYVLSAALVVTGLAGLAIPFTTDFEVFLGLRVLQGVGFSGVMPTTVTLLGDIYDERIEVTAQGIRSFLHNATGAVLPVVAGALIVITWRAPFVLYAICLPAAVLALVVIPDVKSAAERLPPATYVTHLRTILSQPNALGILLAGFSVFFLMYGYLTYAPFVFVRQFSFSPSVVGLYIGLGAIASALGASQAGRIVDRFSQSRVLVGAFIVVGVCLAALPVVGTELLVAIVVVTYGFNWGVIAPTQRSVLNQTVDTSVRAGANSISYSLQSAAKAVAPLAVGVVTAASTYGVGFLSLGLVSLVTGGVILVVNRRSG